MFKKKFNSESFTDLISANTKIDGSINFSGVLKIQGQVNGSIVSLAAESEQHGIIIDRAGSVSSTVVRATNIEIAGLVNSKEIEGKNVKILSTGTVVNATITYQFLTVEPGAKLIDCKLVYVGSPKSDVAEIVEA